MFLGGIKNPDFNPLEIGIKNATFWENKNK